MHSIEVFQLLLADFQSFLFRFPVSIQLLNKCINLRFKEDSFLIIKFYEKNYVLENQRHIHTNDWENVM